MIDCSQCNKIYIHEIAWGEFWCRELDKYIYDLHNLKKRFKDNCEDFKEKEI